MKLSFCWSVTASLLVAVLLDYSGPGSLGSAVSVCVRGHFRPKPTDGCRPCTVCNSRTVETEACKHNADTVCAVGRSCPSDAFYNRATGLCQLCTRFCPSPLVKTSHCLEEADAVCSPRSPRGHSRTGRRRGSAGRTRPRKQRARKRQKKRPLTTEAVSTAAEKSSMFDPFDSIRSNEFPGVAVKSQQLSRLLSNEYPDSSKGRKRIDSKYQTSESLDNYPKNHEVNIKSDSSHMVLSNSLEALN